MSVNVRGGSSTQADQPKEAVKKEEEKEEEVSVVFLDFNVELSFAPLSGIRLPPALIFMLKILVRMIIPVIRCRHRALKPKGHLDCRRDLRVIWFLIIYTMFLQESSISNHHEKQKGLQKC